MIRDQLGAALREALKAKYSRLPSVAFIAREFNLRCHNAQSVSDETVRRWIRGSSMPDAERLSVLVAWLNIDCNKAFGVRRLDRHAVPARLAAIEVYRQDCSDVKRQLCERINRLDAQAQLLLLTFVSAIQITGVDQISKIPL